MNRKTALGSDPEVTRAFHERGRQGSSLKRSELKPKKAMKRTQPRRDWSDARAKVDAAGCCRVCGYVADTLQACHVVGREHDEPKVCRCCRGSGTAATGWACSACQGTGHSSVLYVDPNRIWEGCPACHGRYDPNTRGLDEEPLDLLPFLTSDEKRQAFEDCDYDAFAFLYRTTGQRYVPESEAV